MFSGLSKLADKSFVLGFFLPALLGVVVIIALLHDLRPLSPIIGDVTKLQSFSDLTVVLLVVWTLSVLLMAGSHWMYRVLEGYAWPLKQKMLLARQIKRRKLKNEAARKAYSALEKGAGRESPDETNTPQQKSDLDLMKLEYVSLMRALLLEYPRQSELVLPTRFGNVLRAFEMYAGNVYGVESIHAWPRLLAVVPKEFQITLADARAPVDFFVSSVFLSLTVGLVALARGGEAFMRGPAVSACTLYWSVAVLAFALGRLFYLAAVSSAIAWGEVVKSAFDLYLPELAKTLGYELPKTSDDRRRFWEALANQFQFHEAIQPEMWPGTADSVVPGEYPASESDLPRTGRNDGEAEREFQAVEEELGGAKGVSSDAQDSTPSAARHREIERT